MQYTGTIKKIMEEQVITDKFKKREFVLTDNAPSYPQTIIFEMTNDRCALLGTFKEGDEVDIDFQLRGREWKNPQGDIKYFNTLQAFRISSSKKEGSQQQEKKSNEVRQNSSAKTPENQTVVPTPDDDLPF